MMKLFCDFSESYFFQTQEIILSNVDIERKFLESFAVLSSLIDKLAASDEKFFSGFYTSAVFVIDKYTFDEKLKSMIFEANKIRNRIKKSKMKLEINHCKLVVKSISLILSSLFDVSVPGPIAEFTSDFNFKKIDEPKQNLIDSLRVYIKSKKKVNVDAKGNKISVELICIDDESNEFNIVLWGRWTRIYDYIFKNYLVYLTSLRQAGEFYHSTEATFVVIEPDYLIDSTSLAECYSMYGFIPELYFLSHFAKSDDISLALFRGVLVNSLFDELIENFEVDFDTVLKKAIIQKPLLLFALEESTNVNFAVLRSELARIFNSIKISLPKFKTSIMSVEPSFLSPEYGLQGRLDLLLEDETNPNSKNIIELKSGNAPKPEYSIMIDGQKISTGLWNNHYMQTICYHLLLDSVYTDRKGNATIFYASANEYLLRDAPNLREKKQELINDRNLIVGIEKQIMNQKYEILDKLKINPDMPDYLNNSLFDYQYAYSTLDDTEKAYYHTFLTFIYREIYFQKIGLNDDSARRKGFSSLWNDSLIEKESTYSIMKDLKLNIDESDFEKKYLVFERYNLDNNDSFRKGDICILYPMIDKYFSSPIKNQLIRAVVKDISSSKLTLSLRNKMINIKFDDKLVWAIEPDHIDTANQTLFASLYSFIKAEKRLRLMLLGIIEPQFSNLLEISYPDLNEQKNEILNRAISAKDYFLIQGPPGTGKTSYMVRYIIKYLAENTTENILVLAYTNRAVDELCNSIKNISENIEYLRLGTKDSSELSENMISHLSEKISLNDLKERIKKCRIFVSTVTSAQTNSEIFKLKKFNTLIIDEASQILEPQIIGLITKVDRFIMVGDEKQLPAVVTQNDSFTRVNSEELNKIGLIDCGNSLFGRLVQNAKLKGYDKAYSMLEYQSRMHEDIMLIANKLFYSERLKSFSNSKFKEIKVPSLDSISNDSRIVFINSKREDKPRVNRWEAEKIAEICREVYVNNPDFSSKTIGIISPFRAQCSEIKKHLADHLNEYITVDTVERFQGSERDMMILSLSCNNQSELRQISSFVELDGEIIDRKLNVAISRAKSKLIIIGNGEILKNSPIYKKLLEIIAEKYYYI